MRCCSPGLLLLLLILLILLILPSASVGDARKFFLLIVPMEERFEANRAAFICGEVIAEE